MKTYKNFSAKKGISIICSMLICTLGSVPVLASTASSYLGDSYSSISLKSNESQYDTLKGWSSISDICKSDINDRYYVEVFLKDEILNELSSLDLEGKVDDIVCNLLEQKSYFFKYDLSGDVVDALSDKFNVDKENFAVVIFSGSNKNDKTIFSYLNTDVAYNYTPVNSTLTSKTEETKISLSGLCSSDINDRYSVELFVKGNTADNLASSDISDSARDIINNILEKRAYFSKESLKDDVFNAVSKELNIDKKDIVVAVLNGTDSKTAELFEYTKDTTYAGIVSTAYMQSALTSSNDFTYSLSGVCESELYDRYSVEAMLTSTGWYNLSSADLTEYTIRSQEIINEILNAKAYFSKSKLENDVVKALSNNLKIDKEDLVIVIEEI